VVLETRAITGVTGVPKNTSGLLRTAGPGRPRGSKNRVPPTVKDAFHTVYHQILSEEPDLIMAAVYRGLQSKKPAEAFAYLQIASHYCYGKPVETVKHQGDAQHPMTVVLELHGTTSSSDPKATSTVMVSPPTVIAPIKALP